MSEAFNEDQALSFLQRRDLSADMLTSLARNPEAMKSRKVLLALIAHPCAPRHMSLPLLRRVFTFDLMQVTLTPGVAADIKRMAEEQIMLRLETLSTGEKITLAKRGSGRVAAALLQDPDPRVVEPALDNSQLTEALVVQALMKPRAPATVFQFVGAHHNWRLRHEVQIALLRSEKTPLEHAKELSSHLSPAALREILPESRRTTLLPEVDLAPSDIQDLESGDDQ
jgi:hypothetical protein